MRVMPFSFFLFQYLGRRRPTMFFHTGAGLALILVPVVRALSGPTELVIFLNMVGKVRW